MKDAETHKKVIFIKGAQLHNLKNIDVEIPRHKLTVITGLSGSGKSSLAFDTLYAEGQRRYVESLSSYARQFLGKLDKPKVDYIKGISPAIAIEQKVNTGNPRSTVGTSTEIYDYLKLLFARAGKTYSPVSNKEVKRHSVSDVVRYVSVLPKDTKILLLCEVHIPPGRTTYEMSQLLMGQGFIRIKCESEILRIDELEPSFDKPFELVVGRFSVSDEEGFAERLADAVEAAFYEGKGQCAIEQMESGERMDFTNRFEADGMTFQEPSIHLFSFNNPYGACPQCGGFGNTLDISPSLIIPDHRLSVYEGAIAPWRGEQLSWYKEQLVNNAYKFDFPAHKPWKDLSASQQKLVWTGNKYFIGIDRFFKELSANLYKIQNRILLSRYREHTICRTCNGKRLRPEAQYVRIADKSISDLVDLPMYQLAAFFESMALDDYQAKVSKRLLREIQTRIAFLIDVGLDYLTLNRRSNTLSGGESQRINLATSLGSSLTGSMYILDEPSIGLHSRDSERLIKILQSLRDLGNTVIVVEHDEDMMRAADEIIDMGPEAGVYGGEIVAQGDFKAILKSDSLTAQYLNGRLEIETPRSRRPVKNKITLIGASENNLKDIDVSFPLNMLTVVTGVSGSGKSTLVNKVLHPALEFQLTGFSERLGKYRELVCDKNDIQSVEYIDQNPIGRSSRSNPATYTKAYDEIRQLFASQPLSVSRGFKPKHFSFNVPGGRCETCQGEGSITVEMQFMADVHLTCEVCGGRRFQDEVLEVSFQGKSIADILDTSIDQAIDFFKMHGQTAIYEKLEPLQQVGMGYVSLGQSSSTLSGGEAQRIKLATFLGKGHAKEKRLFIFDEPTTGLHFHDVKKLIKAFNALIENGHSVIVIEHHLDLIKSADYVIDLGPEGGDKGGAVVCRGTPEEITACKGSFTGKFLREKLARKNA